MNGAKMKMEMETKELNIDRELGIALSIVLFVPMFCAVLFFVLFFSGKTEEQAAAEITSSAKAAEIIFQNSVDEMRHLADAYARKKTVLFFSGLDLGVKLGRDLAKSADHDKLDMVTVMDTSHRVLARSHAPEQLKDLFPENLYTIEALNGNAVCGVEMMGRSEMAAEGFDGGNRLPTETSEVLALTGAAPVHDRHDRERIVGAVVLRRILNIRPGILGTISRALDADVALFGRAGRVAQADRIAGNPFAMPQPETLTKVMERNISVSTVKMSQHGNISKCLPVSGFSGNPVGVLMVRKDPGPYLRDRDNAIMILLGMFLIGFALLLVIKRMVRRRLRAEISERRRAEERIRLLHQSLLRAQEEERQRISLDLHDSIIQELAVVQFKYEGIFRHEKSMSQAEAKAKKANAILRKSIASIRSLAHGLRPTALDRLDMVASLSMLCTEFMKDTGVDVDFTLDEERKIVLDYETGINVYRLFQEALNNVRKHADATQVSGGLGPVGPNNAMIWILDDGKGFDMDEVLNRALDETHMGLWGMNERVCLIGGRMDIMSYPGKGTKIYMEFKAKFET